jgi:protein-tyrosine phosphatase
MIDVHCHIIPGVDDGVQTLDSALELIAREVEGGTRAFIATSHVNSIQELERVPFLIEKLAELQTAVDARGIDVKLYPGCELYASSAVVAALNRGLPITMAGTGKYVLLDVPRVSLTMDFSSAVHETCAQGLTPILAHPERCADFQSDPDRVLGFIGAGAVLQLNATSFRGRYGEEAQSLAFRYLKAGMAHFLASDAHRAGTQPILGRAAAALRPIVGDAYLQAITEENGKRIIMGQPLGELPPVVAGMQPEGRDKPASLANRIGRIFGKRV